MKLSQIIAISSSVLFAAFLTTGCVEERGPAQRTGAAIDDAVEDVRDASEDAIDELEDAAEDAAEAAEEAAEDTRRAIEDAVD